MKFLKFVVLIILAVVAVFAFKKMTAKDKTEVKIEVKDPKTGETHRVINENATGAEKKKGDKGEQKINVAAVEKVGDK